MSLSWWSVVSFFAGFLSQTCLGCVGFQTKSQSHKTSVFGFGAFCGHLRVSELWTFASRCITSCSKLRWCRCTSENSYRKHLSNGDPNWGHQSSPKLQTLQLLLSGIFLSLKNLKNNADSEPLSCLGSDYSMCGPKAFKRSSFKIVGVTDVHP